MEYHASTAHGPHVRRGAAPHTIQVPVPTGIRVVPLDTLNQTRVLSGPVESAL
jgi:hypothetical protein